ncbi:MAG TPA: hypothetical protein VED22_06030 [Nitrososphaerales archaeon]|nr:hypothetical protein [Nitrososphaerales archaeon]
MKIRTRSLLVLFVIGLGLVIGAQITPGATSTSSRPPNVSQPDIYFLIPTTASIGISTLNGTASLIVSQINGDLTSAPPIVNVSVVQKDIVTFVVPTRGYYSVEFLERNGIPAAVTYSLTIGGQPFDATLAGAIVLVVGLVGVTLTAVMDRRRSNTQNARNDTPTH